MARELLESSNLSKDASNIIIKEIDALSVDLEEQTRVHHDTLYGVFPLVRLLAPSLFIDDLALGTFELIDDPAVASITVAGKAFCEKVLQKWSSRPQLNVVFTSIPANKALENELLYIFNSYKRFYVHNFSSVVKALSPSQIDQFQAYDITPVIKQQLCKALRTSEILIVGARKVDIVNNDYFYVVEGQLYNINNDDPTHSFLNMGFSRDRRVLFWPLIYGNLILLMLSIIIYLLIIRLKMSAWPLMPAGIVIAVSGFIMGRIISPILISMLEFIAPPPETLAIVSFWWPCIAGLALFLVPAIFYRFISPRISGFAPTFDIIGKEDALFTTTAIGVSAYLIGPLFLFLNRVVISEFLPVILCGGIASYILGRTFCAHYSTPLYGIFVPITVFAGLGAAFSHLSLSYLWTCTGIVTFFGAMQFKLDRAVEPGSKDEGVQTSNILIPADASELSKRSECPPYKRLGIYNEAFKSVRPLLEGETVWLVLTGSNGVGKTSTADALIKELREMLKKDGRSMVLLQGECPEKISSVKPYAPFTKALARHFGINMLSPKEGQLEQINSALEGIVSMVPFASFISSSTTERSIPASSKMEIFISIVNRIKKLAQKNRVVLFIDDVHWMDEASCDLLSFLLDNFPPGSRYPLLILLTSLTCGGIVERMKEQRLPIELPDKQQQIDILVSCLGLKNEVAHTVTEKVAITSNDQGGLFWLFRAVASLAEKGYLERTEDGFAWSDKYEGDNNLPIPIDFIAAIEEQLSKVSNHLYIIRCAACLGLKFSARILSDSLKIPHFELLQILEQIENDTGILFDDNEIDDIYAFRSAFVLQIIREKMRISGSGPMAKDVPQINRKYHARIASSLEKTVPSSPDNFYEVAKHYYAAGRAYTKEAFDYSIKAAHMVLKEFSYRQAHEFVNMARECAEVIGLEYDIDAEYILIDCYRAHIENVGHKEIADKGLSYLETHKNASFEVIVAVARACYEMGRDSGDQKYFSEAVRLGRLIVDRADTSFEEAEGYHFVGISLTDSGERRENLEKALSIVESLSEKDILAIALQARVANSLAEELSYGTQEDKNKAEELFYLSIKIKSKPEIHDLPGLARSHGGIARLALSKDKPDISTARKHFLKDLEYSEKIGDIGGQCMMHSMLGECDILEKDFESAFKNYEKSLEYAHEPPNRFFALTGLFMSSCELSRTDDLISYTGELLNLYDVHKNISKPCAITIRDTIEKCEFNINNNLLDRLKILVNQALGTEKK